ncbi:hypothetical protein [Azospirillum sp. ST 5-10]|uniref:hypothetical protein n=1 Tax=unclassified Azospirillum TaxID=2630922 RepID=UPI003F4A3D72
MTYISWAAHYEGSADRSYFDILIPRVMEDITLREGVRSVIIPTAPAIILGRSGRQVANVARELCENSQAFFLVFIHADTGGRAVSETLPRRGRSYCDAAHDACGWNPDRCVALEPRHEMEAWALADPVAVALALGYSRDPANLGLPRNATEAERLGDPKAALERAARTVQRRRNSRGSSQLFPMIAQTQSLNALRDSDSFRRFEEQLRIGLRSLGCL